MSPRNVLLLHTDQQRADSLGCNGNPHARTPQLDRLAASGTTFTRHLACNPICMPSRAGLLTGLYPPAHNVWCNGVALNRREYATLDTRLETVSGIYCPEPATLADCFAAAGYDTAGFGKFHLTPFLAPESYRYPETISRWDRGELADWHGPYYGFRYVDMIVGHGEQPCGHYLNWLQREHPEVLRRVREERQPRPHPSLDDLYASTVPFELHHSSWLADRLIAYLQTERPAGQPFFAFVGFPDPHHPFTPCAEILREFAGAPVHSPGDPQGTGQLGSPVLELNQEQPGQVPAEAWPAVIRHTYAMVYQIDLAIGRILDALERLGLADDTIVAFTSDHGDYLGDHGLLRKSYGASDSLLRVPFVLRAPGVELPAQVAAPMSNTDVLPTLAALAGVTPPEGRDGTDILRALATGEPHEAFAFSSLGEAATLNHTIYDDRYRLTWYPNRDYVELFDHQEDPAECRNLGADPAQRERLGEMRRRLTERLAAGYNPILGRVCAW